MSRNQSSSSSTSQAKSGKVSHVIFCNVFLEELAKKLNSNLPEGIKPEVSDEWKKKVIELAGHSMSISFHEEQCKKIISELETNTIKDFKSDKLEDRVEEVRAILKKRSQGFDPNTNDSYKRIKNMLKQASSGDDDVEVFENGTSRDTDFKCPITSMAFVEPMKNQNVKAKCIHRVSKAGFEQMMKKTCQNRGITRDKASLQCPVTGCRGLWTDADTVLDEEMVARMEMHGRSQANLTQQQLHSSQEDAIDLDD